MASKSKKTTATVWLERFSLKDKGGMLSIPEPTEYMLNIMMLVGNKQIVARSFTFTTSAARDDHYSVLKNMLGV